MKRELGPNWSQAERRAGERLSQAWEEHFRAAEGQSQPRPEAAAALAEAARVTEVSERAGAALMRYPNVIGFSEGVRVRNGKPTGDGRLRRRGQCHGVLAGGGGIDFGPETRLRQAFCDVFGALLI